jgi:hypothetical protein
MSDDSGGGKEKPSQFDRSLRLTDVFITVFAGLSFGAAAVSAAVAIWTATQLGAASEQTERAIGKLATLADQTKRSADYAQGQVGALRDQVGALKDQVAEARKQTKAIAAQTSAIKASSAAAVQSAAAEIKTAQAEIGAAQAQETSARAMAQANLPSMFLASITFDGLDSPPDKDGLVNAVAHPQFGNNGGTMFQRSTALKLSADIPKTPPDFSTGAFVFGGNELSIAHGEKMYPNEPVPLRLLKGEMDAFRDGKLFLFMVGNMDYADAAQQPHRWCFAYFIVMAKSGATFYSAPNPAYHCQT